MFRFDLPSLTSIFKSQICIEGNPQNTPNMDVVRIDTYLTLGHKIEDTETHHIRDQA